MKAEYGDFYKFIVSVGVGLVSLAVIVPWLFLRESFDLLQKKEDIEHFTDAAQQIIATRQYHIGVIISYVPVFSLISFILGIFIIGFGGFFWWQKTQKITDEKQQTDLGLAKAQLRKATEAEITTKKEQEAVAVLQSEKHDVSIDTNKQEVKVYVEKLTSIEERMITTLRNCFSVEFEILTDRHLGNNVTFDCLLLSKSDYSKDAIVAIKYIRKNFNYNWLIDNLNRTMYGSAIYTSQTNRRARSVLIIIAPKSVLSASQEYASRVIEENIDFYTNLSLLFLSEENLDDINCEELSAIRYVGRVAIH